MHRPTAVVQWELLLRRPYRIFYVSRARLPRYLKSVYICKTTGHIARGKQSLYAAWLCIQVGYYQLKEYSAILPCSNIHVPY